MSASGTERSPRGMGGSRYRSFAWDVQALRRLPRKGTAGFEGRLPVPVTRVGEPQPRRRAGSGTSAR